MFQIRANQTINIAYLMRVVSFRWVRWFIFSVLLNLRSLLFQTMTPILLTLKQNRSNLEFTRFGVDRFFLVIKLALLFL